MKKKRSIASYRAASLKGARTRKRMKQAREINWLKDLKISFAPISIIAEGDWQNRDTVTINRIPKVEWK